MDPTVASLTAQPRPLKVRIAGVERTYLIHPLTIDDLGQLQAWVDSQFPDPFAVVAKTIREGDYTVPQQQFLMSQAMALAVQPRHAIGSPEADRVLLGTLAGTCELLKLAIRKGRELSDEEARDIFLHLTIAELAALQTYTGIDLVTSDPKAPPPTKGESGSSTSRGRRRRGSTSGTSSTRR